MHRRLGRLAILAVTMIMAASCAPAMAETAVDRLGIAETLAFDDTVYRLAWSAEPTSGYTKQEYLPKGQDLETWQSMLIVEFLAGDADPMAMAGVQARALEARKATDPIVNFEIVRSDTADEVILDFVLSGKDAAGGPVVEWNAYRYARAKDKRGRAGSLLFAVSRRAYGEEDAARFLKNLAPLRGKDRTTLSQIPLPLR